MTYRSTYNYISFVLVLILSSPVLLECSETIKVKASPGECAAIIFHDGYSHFCTDIGEEFLIELKPSVYEYTGVLLYRKKQQTIVDLMIVEFAKMNSSSRDISPAPLAILWPSEDEIISSSTADFYYFVRGNDNYDDSFSSELYICVVVAQFSGSDNNSLNTTASSSRLKCTVAIKKNIITVNNLINGIYLASFFLVSVEAGVERSGVDDYIRNFLTHTKYNYKPKRSLRFCISSILPSGDGTRTTWPLLLFPSLSGEYSSEIFEGGVGSDTSSIIQVVLMSARSRQRYQEAEIFLKSLLYHFIGKGGVTFTLVLHVVTEAAGRRFFEWLWIRNRIYHVPNVVLVLHDFERVCGKPLDEFLSTVNMRESFHHSGKAGYCRLFMPAYFHELRGELRESGTVLVRLISGQYGSVRMRSSIENVLYPSKIIALETDQLMLTNVADLWDLFNSFDNDDIVAAAENYQPWQLSRPFADVDTHIGLGESRETTTTVGDQSSRALPHHDGSYHGYGIIGGVMLLNLARLDAFYPHGLVNSLIIPALSRFREKGFNGSSMCNTVKEGLRVSCCDRVTGTSDCSGDFGPSIPLWQAKLNDQDIFNVLFTIRPELLMILPCEWNVQLHARLNTILHCMHHIFDERFLAHTFAVVSHNLDIDMACNTSEISGNKSPDSSSPSGFSCHVSGRPIKLIDILSASSGALLSVRRKYFSLSPEDGAEDLWGSDSDDDVTQNIFKKGYPPLIPPNIHSIPLNCPSSESHRLFVCPQKAKVLHFMARSYGGDYHFLGYYAHFWKMYESLSWNEITMLP